MAKKKGFSIWQTLCFVMTMLKKNAKAPVFSLLEEGINQARYYQRKSSKKAKGIMVIFPGGNPHGFADPRYVNLVRGLMQLGYDGLILQLQSQREIRLGSQEDYDRIASFLNFLLSKKLMPYDSISFIGPSTSTSYLIQVATHEGFSYPIHSMFLISPVYDPERTLRRLVENPLSVYGQLVCLKLILNAQYEHDSQAIKFEELQILDQLILMSHQHKDKLSADALIQLSAGEFKLSEHLKGLIQKLGTPGFISEDLHPFFVKFTQEAKFAHRLSLIKSKVTIIHSEDDDIFLPEESIQMIDVLKKSNVDTHLFITKLFAHANLSSKYLLKEFFGVKAALNHFFSN